MAESSITFIRQKEKLRTFAGVDDVVLSLSGCKVILNRFTSYGAWCIYMTTLSGLFVACLPLHYHRYFFFVQRFEFNSEYNVWVSNSIAN